MSDTLRIVVPLAPPKGLMSNHRRRNHWREQARDTDALREAVRYATATPTRRVRGRYTLDVTVVWGPDSYTHASRLPDLDNLPPAIKPICDQLQVIGVIDNDRLCAEYTIRQRLGDSGAVILDLREAEA
jgi:Holliday junction resolvase RusA-like endonuclease